jgi:hypothetical protein
MPLSPLVIEAMGGQSKCLDIREFSQMCDAANVPVIFQHDAVDLANANPIQQHI